MASGKDPPIAKAVIKEAVAALKQRNLVYGFRSVTVRESGVPLLAVRNTTGIPVTLARPLPGRWSVYFNWLFLPIPPDGKYELLRSSFGLNVTGLVGPAAQQNTTFVRYDVANDRAGPEGTLGCHINVWQPSPIDDNVHFPVPGLASNAWPVRDVLSFFLSESLADDLLGRIV